MSVNAFLSIQGVKQGQIKGSVTQKGREGQIAVYAVQHEIKSPRDVATGQATGKRQHGALTITKEIDKSTPLLLQAEITNETLKEVILRFWSPQNNVAGTGVEVNSYTIKLTNASIASIKLDMELNKTDPGLKLPVLEVISIVYQKIEWTWMDGGITAMDDWTAVV